MIPNFFFSACAKKFAAEGSKVILCARNEVELKRVKKEISGDEVIVIKRFWYIRKKYTTFLKLTFCCAVQFTLLTILS